MEEAGRWIERRTKKKTLIAADQVHIHPKLNENIITNDLRSRIKLQKKAGNLQCFVRAELY